MKYFLSIIFVCLFSCNDKRYEKIESVNDSTYVIQSLHVVYDKPDTVFIHDTVYKRKVVTKYVYLKAEVPQDTFLMEYPLYVEDSAGFRIIKLKK